MKTEIPCPPQTDRTMVAFVCGQSNAANASPGTLLRGQPGRVFNVFSGKCYEAADPLLGLLGNGCSVWMPMANALVAAGLFDRIIIAGAAEGGIPMQHWRAGTPRFAIIRERLAELRRLGLSATHVLWHQGESDKFVNTAENYAAGLGEIIGATREVFPASFFFVSIASLCFDGGVDPEIQRGQRLAIDPARNVFEGPNTDLINDPGDRYDGCHFAAQGLAKHAAEWVRILTAHRAAAGATQAAPSTSTKLGS